jgi:hypothetical protein
MVRGRWDDPSVDRSFYLETAKYIRDHTDRDDRVIVSGGGQGLLALSRRLPPSAWAIDLSMMSLMRYPERRPDVIEKLRQQPPRLVIETLRQPVALHDYWPDFESRYHLVKTCAKDDKKHYGSFGARIWELKK